MQPSVTGKQIGVGDALRSHIETALDATVPGHCDSAVEESAVLAKPAHLIRADVSAHLGCCAGSAGAAALGDPWNFPS